MIKHLKTNKYILPLILMVSLVLASCTESSAPVYPGPEIRIIDEDSYTALERQFNRISYHFDRVADQGVPPLVLRNLPENISDINSTSQRKSLFLQAMLPMVLLANDEITFERQKLAKLKKNFNLYQSLKESELLTLENLTRRYKVEFDPEHPNVMISKLELRIDIIPVDLALAQAANESAWGTSRFSRVANNLFGQWTFQQGQGIVPMGRPQGATYEVRKFETVYDSVRSYLNNLNTHTAYREFRKMRQLMRVKKQPLDGVSLAEGLLRYSTRGEEYVRELQLMIRNNRLKRLQSAQLRATDEPDLGRTFTSFYTSHYPVI